MAKTDYEYLTDMANADSGIKAGIKEYTKLTDEIGKVMSSLKLDLVELEDNFGYLHPETLIDREIDNFLYGYGDGYEQGDGDMDEEFMDSISLAMDDNLIRVEEAHMHVTEDLKVGHEQEAKLFDHVQKRLKKLPKHVRRMKTRDDYHIMLSDKRTGYEYVIWLVSHEIARENRLNTNRNVRVDPTRYIVLYDPHELKHKTAFRRTMEELDDAFDEAVAVMDDDYEYEQ